MGFLSRRPPEEAIEIQKAIYMDERAKLLALLKEDARLVREELKLLEGAIRDLEGNGGRARKSSKILAKNTLEKIHKRLRQATRNASWIDANDSQESLLITRLEEAASAIYSKMGKKPRPTNN